MGDSQTPPMRNNTHTTSGDMASRQQQQNDGSGSGAAGKEPLYDRYQRTKKSSASKESFIVKICPWFFKKSEPTDAEQSTEQSQPEKRDEATTPALVDTSKVHGYENQELWLVRCLIKPDDGDFKAIGIVGMPELGKTALARLVFDNEYVKQYFLPKIWVSVSAIGKPKKQKVVETILRELDVDNEMIADIAERGVDALLYALHLKLAGKRYLIVLDGVSKDDDCCRNLRSPDPADSEKENEEFSFAFPKGSGGAVIVTSRRKEAAEKMVGEGEGEEEEKKKILHTPRPIEDLDSCFSIYNSVLDKQVPEKSITEDLKKELRMKSGGLPVAARLMARIKNEQGQTAGVQEPPPQSNDRTKEPGHQTGESEAENREIVQEQEQKESEDAHRNAEVEDEDWERVSPTSV